MEIAEQMSTYDAIFLIGSTIKPNRYQHFSTEDRLSQTIATSQSIRSRIPLSLCILVEGSILNPKQLALLAPHYDHILECGVENTSFIDHVENIGHGEMKLMEIGLEYLTNSILPTSTAKYLFKISGRYTLDDNFDLANYSPDLFCFKRQIDTGFGWDVYVTALYSIPLGKLGEYKSVLIKGQSLLSRSIPEVERVFFLLVPESSVETVERLGLDGRISYNGTYVAI